MTKDMFATILARAECKTRDDGGADLPEGKTLTLYLSRDGTSLQVSRVVEMKLDSGIVEAATHKGEMFLVALDDLFAASVSGGSKSTKARKAGFLG
ncbi:MAG: hypothetical protein JRI68_12650 [Deltaproteobacteria bacterium]|nr:hypothetical protein [Deltaproteobacteria bacterium]